VSGGFQGVDLQIRIESVRLSHESRDKRIRPDIRISTCQKAAARVSLKGSSLALFWAQVRQQVRGAPGVLGVLKAPLAEVLSGLDKKGFERASREI